MAALRIGLAGLGVHGMRYARHLLAGDVPGARLVAVSRANRAAGAAFADEHALRFHRNPADLALDPGVDALVAVLPPDLHPALAEAAIVAGKPILVEKPLAPDVARARRIVASAERHGTPVMVAQTLRFDAVVEALRAALPDIGELRLVSINQRFEPSNRPWIDTPGRGGVILNTGIHGFDLLRHLTGLEPVEISAHSGRRVTRHTEDQFVAWIRLEPGGVVAVIDNVRNTHSRSGRIELVGERGQLWGDHVHRTFRHVEGNRVLRRAELPPAPTIPITLRTFADSVRQSRPMPIGPRDGLAAVALVEAAYRAAASGERVTLDSLGPGA